MKKRLLILGVSGSIGTQTIDVVRAHSDLLEITGVSIYTNYELLSPLLSEFPTIKHVYLKRKTEELTEKYPEIVFYDELDGLEAICKQDDYDLLVNALVGNTGMLPTIAAIKNNKNVALANKETLVIAGEIINKLLKKHNVKLYPIDSEHSAIQQLIHKKDESEIKSLIITASGGSFRDKTKEELVGVTVEDALKHPTWSMGKKITIDSSTLINKVYEVIEAHHLFGIEYDSIRAVIQKESIIHSMVEFNDGSVLAQLSYPDMRLPIQFALLDNRHLNLASYNKLDFDCLTKLSFMPINRDRYSLFYFAIEKAKRKGNYPAILNGSNDKAVELFLEGKIEYLDIEKAIMSVFDHIAYIEEPSFEQLISSQQQAQDYVLQLFNITSTT